MRVMIDTNVLLSALLFPSQWMNALIDRITTKHQLVLSSYVVDELMNVTRRKFKGKEEAVDLLLSQLPNFCTQCSLQSLAEEIRLEPDKYRYLVK